jgi:hypothetical protein
MTNRPGPTSPMRTFDPVRLGNAEADAWIAYYRRDWLTLLRAAVAMVRVGFALPFPRDFEGAWYVLRGNQLWAPFPTNDPAGATAQMRKFYALVTRLHRETFDIDVAANLEVGWWRAHRELQHRDRYPHATNAALVAALASLYSHVYGVPAEVVEPAAEARADAMEISDAWVADGCDPRSPALDSERQALIRGYVALRAAVGRP